VVGLGGRPTARLRHVAAIPAATNLRRAQRRGAWQRSSRSTDRSTRSSWGLVFLTIGIYGFVWYFKINDEARGYLRDESIKPGIALLAILLGWILIIPPFVSYYRTGERIGRMEKQAGIQSPISPALGLLAALVLSAHVLYMQEHLNRIWERAGTPQAPPG
jgi:hypothetical protein